YTNPSTQVQTLLYDTRGRLWQGSWSAIPGVPAGPTVITEYDDASRPISIRTSDGTNQTAIAYGYDNANNKIWEEQSLSDLPSTRPVPAVSAVSRKTPGSAG